MKVSKGLVSHSVVVCSEKRERRGAVLNLVQKIGFKGIGVQSLYDALKVISQEMPHLVITDARLSDGTAGTLFDRLAAHKVLSKTPILVLVPVKTKEQLTPLKGRKFSGFLLGELQEKALTAKVQEILSGNFGISPFFIGADGYGLGKGLAIGISGALIGQQEGFIVAKCDSEIDASAPLVCCTGDQNRPPALLKVGTSAVKEDQISIYFPIDRVRGKGRIWLSQLPEIGRVNKQESDDGHQKVIFFDPNRERFDQFKEILSGYGIDLIHAGTLQSVAGLLQQHAEGLGAVYLYELTSDAAGIPLKQSLESLDPKDRPPMVIGTSSLISRSTAGWCYIKKPFGLGTLVEMFQSVFRSRQQYQMSEAVVTDISVSFQAPAELIGLDETGGIMQTKFPINKGSILNLEHEFLHKIWDGDTRVQVDRIVPVGNSGAVWQVKFILLQIGSRTRYWEKLSKKLSVEGSRAS